MHKPRPLVGLIRNPLSHRNRNRPERGETSSSLLVRAPTSHGELRKVLEEFEANQIDYLAVEGGDGTMRDVLTCGAAIFGNGWPPLIVLPKGKTNALAVDIALPRDWSLKQALEAARRGEFAVRRPLRLARRSSGPAGGNSAPHGPELIQGFFLGAGAFKRGTDEGQAVHRLSLFDSLAVGVIVLWSILQTVLGGARNRWRRTTRMRLASWPEGERLPHSRPGEQDERFLFVATTYEKFPLGARPFGRTPHKGLKLGIIDWPRRWLLAMLPLIAFGLCTPAMARAGAHRIQIRAAEMEIGESFIMDGETFPPGRYILSEGPELQFVVP